MGPPISKGGGWVCVCMWTCEWVYQGGVQGNKCLYMSVMGKRSPCIED